MNQRKTAKICGEGSSQPPLTIEELRALSRKLPKEVHPQEAMNCLPVEFTALGEVTKGESFMDELYRIMDERKWNAASGKPVFDFNEHTVYGIVQLAHYLRDQFTGSRRGSFNRILPGLLDAKAKVIKKKPANVAEFFSRKLWPPSCGKECEPLDWPSPDLLSGDEG